MIGAMLFAKPGAAADSSELPEGEPQIEQCEVHAVEYNIVLHGFIELSNQVTVIGEPVCNCGGICSQP